MTKRKSISPFDNTHPLLKTEVGVEVTHSASIQLANLFDLPAATANPPRMQPCVSEESCARYASRLDVIIKESNNYSALFRYLQMFYCPTDKIFSDTLEKKARNHTRLVFDPFSLTAETAGEFLFLSRVHGYLFFTDSIPYSPLVPHNVAVLQFLNYFGIVPDFVIASPFGLTSRGIKTSIERLQFKVGMLEHELNDCHPRAKLKKEIAADIQVLNCDLEALDHAAALIDIR